jgi:hypothetical protein
MRLCVSSRHLDIHLLQELVYELDLFCTLGSVVIVVTNLVSFLSLENESRILFLLYKKTICIRHDLCFGINHVFD